jgi:hypothetical protein
MRAITGALLLVAASICWGAGVIASSTQLESHDSSRLAFMPAVVLGIVGILFLSYGLRKDRF